MKISVFFYIVMSLFSIPSSVSGQFNTSSKIKGAYSIVEVEILDTALINGIRAFIVKETESDSLFNKVGYISLAFDQKLYKGEQVLYSCFFNKSFDVPENDKALPLFYTYINNRLITIKNSIVSESLYYSISRKSVRKYKKLLKQYLPESEKIWFEESDGKKRRITWREPIVVIHGGKRFYKLLDGTTALEDLTY